MAINWKNAQINEKQFWDKIYLEKNYDIRSHQPVRVERGLEFLFKTLNRHRVKLNFLNKKNVADLGCGPTGLALGLDFLLQNSYLNQTKIFAIDPLINHYERYGGLLKNSKRLSLINKKGENTGLNNNSLDLVFSTNAIDHFDNPEQVIKEVRRILKPSGRFLVSSHVLYRVYSSFVPIFKYIDKNHPHHFTETSLKTLLEKEFERVELTYSATMIEDNPDLSFYRILRSPTVTQGFKRALSNYIFQTLYFSCE